jgi:uncharacterized protein
MRRLSIITDDGVSLDARIDGPAHPPRVVVWCHPHPLFGGSMLTPLMNAVADGLSAHGIGVLRFDFRGVGTSGGSHEGGIGERRDVEAAMATAAEITGDLTLAGWSFGADIALQTIDRFGPDIAYVGVAPPLADPPPPTSLRRRPAIFVIGTRDRVVDNEAIEAYAGAAGADVVTVEGADHLFTLRSAPIVEAIIGAGDGPAGNRSAGG